MGTLDKFLGTPKEVEILGDKVALVPIKVKDLGKVIKQNPTEEEVKQISKELIKLSVEGSTDEIIDNLPIEVFIKLVDEINILNGFKDEQADRLKKHLEQRKQ